MSAIPHRAEPRTVARKDQAKHGVATPRGLVSLPVARGGRYGRMFRFLPPARIPDASVADRFEERVADAMIAAAGRSGPNPSIPAGYTYLGQLIDHDVTFDPTSRLGSSNDPYELLDFRTPRLDLDCLYGSGPLDQPFLYDWNAQPAGVGFLLGRDGGGAPRDLPRNQDGRALTGDARDDENLIVSQLHLLFLRFHNRMAETVVAEHPDWEPADVFDEAQRRTRWHYQWLVLHDFLSKVLGREANGGLTRRFFRWTREPFMPVEFSAAAYRYGHSMIREDYRLNASPGSVPLIPRADPERSLQGFRPLPPGLEIEWERFFLVDRQRPPQSSMAIDTSLVRALERLPAQDAPLPLARLDLLRGLALGLPAGDAVARALGETPLAPDELLAPLPDLEPDDRTALVAAPPLWYYVLCEAETRAGGAHLGPVGGRIVEEVLVGLLQGDPGSYLRRQPEFEPELPTTGASFAMGDFVRFARGDPPPPAGVSPT